MAKRDAQGNLATTPAALKSLYLETYRHRLRHRKMDSKYEDVLYLKTELWKCHLSNLKKKVTNPWTIVQLEKALKSLKNNQARDPMGLINELFKPGMIGQQLKAASLSLMNSVKLSMQTGISWTS